MGKLKTFGNVNMSNFSFNKKNWLCINVSNEIIIYDEDLNRTEVKFENVNFGIFYKNYFWTSNNLSSTTFMYKDITELNHCVEHNFIAGFSTELDKLSRKKTIIANGFKNNNYTKSISFELEKDTFRLITEYENIGFNGIYQVINDDFFLTQNNEKFGVFTFDNVCVWECYYKDLFENYEPIGAGTTNILKVGDKLYVELDKTYCIEIETGKTEQVYNYKFIAVENEFLYGLQFLSMTVFHLAILNTKTNTIKIIDVSDEFNKLNVYPDNRIVVNNGLVYFSQNMGTDVAKIGVLSPVSGKILWKYDFEKKNGMIGTLKVNCGRIYAHTQDKTLHIFEKTTTQKRIL